MPMVKGIKGGGYEPENNFEMSDLSEEKRNFVYEKKPSLMPLTVYLERKGCDEHFRESCIARIKELNQDWVGFYKRHWEDVNGEWRFVYSQASWWTEFLETYGTERVSHLIHSDDYWVSTPEEFAEYAGTELPQAYIDKMMDYVWDKCEDDIKDKFG
jgi:hypothetical protein